MFNHDNLNDKWVTFYFQRILNNVYMYTCLCLLVLSFGPRERLSLLVMFTTYIDSATAFLGLKRQATNLGPLTYYYVLLTIFLQ